MNDFIIEDGVLKAYLGHERIVVVPEGVRQLGGELDIKDERRRNLIGDLIGYKAFYNNKTLEELYLPDSLELFGFKCMEHCENLKVLSFSNHVSMFECNALTGSNMEKIIFRGTIFEFCKYDIGSQNNIKKVICTDGTISFDRDYFIDTLNFPGTIEEWNNYQEEPWLKRRSKRVVCTDGKVEIQKQDLNQKAATVNFTTPLGAPITVNYGCHPAGQYSFLDLRYYKFFREEGRNGMKRETINYQGTLLQLIEDNSFDDEQKEKDKIICSDCVVSFCKRYFVDEYVYDGTCEKWYKQYGNHWINRRIKKVVCSDGIVDRGGYFDNFSDKYTVENGVLKAVSEDALIDIGVGGIKTLLIPDDVVVIEGTLDSQNKINIILSDSVKTIKSGAFSNCGLIRHIEIQDSVELIEEGAFGDRIRESALQGGTFVEINFVRYNGTAEKFKRIQNSEIAYIPCINTIDGHLINKG